MFILSDVSLIIASTGETLNTLTLSSFKKKKKSLWRREKNTLVELLINTQVDISLILKGSPLKDKRWYEICIWVEFDIRRTTQDPAQDKGLVVNEETSC